MEIHSANVFTYQKYQSAPSWFDTSDDISLIINNNNRDTLLITMNIVQYISQYNYSKSHYCEKRKTKKLMIQEKSAFLSSEPVPTFLFTS